MGTRAHASVTLKRARIFIGKVLHWWFHHWISLAVKNRNENLAFTMRFPYDGNFLEVAPPQGNVSHTDTINDRSS